MTIPLDTMINAQNKVIVVMGDEDAIRNIKVFKHLEYFTRLGIQIFLQPGNTLSNIDHADGVIIVYNNDHPNTIYNIADKLRKHKEDATFPCRN